MKKEGEGKKCILRHQSAGVGGGQRERGVGNSAGVVRAKGKSAPKHAALSRSPGYFYGNLRGKSCIQGTFCSSSCCSISSLPFYLLSLVFSALPPSSVMPSCKPYSIIKVVFHFASSRVSTADNCLH